MIDLYPNSTLLYQWLIFMAALVVLNWGVFRPVLRLLRERRQRTEGDEKRAAEFEGKITDLKSQVDAGLEKARHEGQEIIQHLRQEAEASSQQTMELARQRMEAQLGQMRTDLEKAGKEAELQLKQHARKLADELGTNVLERPVS